MTLTHLLQYIGLILEIVHRGLEIKSLRQEGHLDNGYF